MSGADDLGGKPPARLSPHADLARLRALTPARLRLDPAGGAAPLSSVLGFARDHALARDAIHLPVDWEALAAALPGAIRVQSQAETRDVYLRRPDLGRRLAPDSRARLEAEAGAFDIAVMLGDGLSANAAQRGAPLVEAVRAALPGLSFAPTVLAEQARVGLGDDVGQALGAGLVLVLIGERPGLSVADSLGAYLTLNPAPGAADSARNCVSNIHDNGGLSIEAAAARIAWLVRRARQIGATGVALKDMSDAGPEALE
ncbi:ethanolamine ammonia-lyase subunit EutC [Rhodovulum sp. DZ06]|uniref:ethanolamine ammonia-lyase subunit EutC n=1 Tax=Rhodovulum sp. DZ06 TaxID=3425126 RepID=UPI003D32F9CE